VLIAKSALPSGLIATQHGAVWLSAKGDPLAPPPESLHPTPPHFPRGAIAQAWGVAEVLRVWRLLARAAADSG